MLGAVVGFLSILVSRLERVIDRHRELRANADSAVSEKRHAVPELLRRRMRLLNRAILFGVLSALVTAALLVVSFAAGLFGMGHGTAVAVFFTLALILMMAALTDFAREICLQTSTMHLE